MYRSFFLSLILLVSGACQSFDVARNGQAVERSFDRFVSEPTQANWSGLLSSVDKDPGLELSRLVSLVVQNHEARDRRDLPNSMALENVSPDEFVTRQIQVVDQTLGKLKSMEDPRLWILLKSLSLQGFDEFLVWSSAELLFRLNPRRFEEVASIVSPDSEKTRIFAETKARWSQPPR
ncbi:MAG TPA: hypothetical protein VKF36_14725 [Syntrophorhabdales bacterium]|nr:hypothetical protein [Syntrophorhabdales bacterium]